MKPKRIEEDHWVLIQVRYALTSSIAQLILSVLWVIAVRGPTTEWRNSTTLKNTKSSSVRPIQIKQIPVTMVTCVPSLILKKKSLLICSINLIKMQIFTCSILRQSGAPTVIPTTLVMHAFTLIIGRISEENLISLTMRKNNVPNGRQRILSRLMLMDANMSTDASFLTDGKNKSITH